jgi:glyoxylate/hydroxypyruvate reductase
MMNQKKDTINVLIASYLEPEYIERICQVDSRLKIIYRPDLLGVPRYAADHTAPARKLNEAEEAEWRKYLAGADILFDFDYSRKEQLAELAPNVRWIQATSAGIGQFVKRMKYDQLMPETIFTTASGVHARPLAEFVIMAMLIHFKGLSRNMEDKRNHHWERYAGTDLEGRTLGLVGLGRIGSMTARMARCMGMKVIGTDLYPNEDVVDQFYPLEDLQTMLPHCEVLVLSVPHTPQTEKMIGGDSLNLLPKGAFFINIARGLVVDEEALIRTLKSNHLGGAALDVFAVEPLPAESPLWDMPNVLICPHSASTSDRENSRITDIFVENLRRYLAGERLLNVLNPELMF